MKKIILILVGIFCLSALHVIAAPSQKSTAFSLASVFKALQMANPSGKAWKARTPRQQQFMQQYQAASMQMLPLLRQWVKGKRATKASDLNRWFAQNGFPGMRIRECGSGCVGGIFDLTVKWMRPGQEGEIEANGKNFKAVKMARSQYVRIHAVEGYKYPLVELTTSSGGWLVYLLESDTCIAPERLPVEAMKLLARSRSEISRYYYIHFPEVRMSTKVDIRWIQKMEVPGFRIDEAIKQVKLRLDRFGARAQAATGFGFRGMPPTYEITKPFLVIFWKPGLTYPPFVAYSRPDSWIPAKPPAD